MIPHPIFAVVAGSQFSPELFTPDRSGGVALREKIDILIRRDDSNVTPLLIGSLFDIVFYVGVGVFRRNYLKLRGIGVAHIEILAGTVKNEHYRNVVGVLETVEV